LNADHAIAGRILPDECVTDGVGDVTAEPISLDESDSGSDCAYIDIEKGAIASFESDGPDGRLLPA
jgi:hypothetical protein